MRGAAVKADSPAKRERSAATRLDGGEHTPRMSVGRCPGHHNILWSAPGVELFRSSRSRTPAADQGVERRRAASRNLRGTHAAQVAALVVPAQGACRRRGEQARNQAREEAPRDVGRGEASGIGADDRLLGAAARAGARRASASAMRNPGAATVDHPRRARRTRRWRGWRGQRSAARRRRRYRPVPGQVLGPEARAPEGPAPRGPAPHAALHREHQGGSDPRGRRGRPAGCWRSGTVPSGPLDQGGTSEGSGADRQPAGGPGWRSLSTVPTPSAVAQVRSDLVPSLAECAEVRTWQSPGRWEFQRARVVLPEATAPLSRGSTSFAW